MDVNLSKDELIAFEEDIKAEFLAGHIRAPVHLAGGNEDQLIELFREVRVNDYLLTTYRNHYHCLLKGMPPERLKEHIMAGRSMYLCDPDYSIISSAIVGGMLPIAVGLALGLKMRGSPDKVWCFLGDMAAETGGFLEATKYAGRHGLPIVFIIEDNSLSTNSPTQEVWGVWDGGRSKSYSWQTVAPETIGCDYAADVRYYRYERTVPHVGCGEWVTFS